jgi:hypothetical protein
MDKIHEHHKQNKCAEKLMEIIENDIYIDSLSDAVDAMAQIIFNHVACDECPARLYCAKKINRSECARQIRQSVLIEQQRRL